jgi:hypothetical protein
VSPSASPGFSWFAPSNPSSTAASEPISKTPHRVQSGAGHQASAIYRMTKPIGSHSAADARPARPPRGPAPQPAGPW